MKSQTQKRRSFKQEIEQLKQENNLKEEKQVFTNTLKKSATPKKQRTSSH